MARQNKVTSSIRRTAGEIKNYRLWRKFIPIGIGIASAILAIGYVIAVLYTRYGAFTVMVNKFDSLDYQLSLSESTGYEGYTSRLNAEISERITNISGTDLPEFLDNIDGPHNGENYVAYTFYCKNAGKKTVSYSYELYIANMTLDIEKAVRVRLYVDGDYTDYAYPRTDGIEGPEPGTVKFLSEKTITKANIEHFKPGDLTKYTVVIWLEGNDPECVDRILGGEMKVDMKLEVIYDEDERKAV